MLALLFNKIKSKNKMTNPEQLQEAKLNSKDIRQQLAEQHGLKINAESLDINDEQKAKVKAEFFASPDAAISGANTKLQSVKEKTGYNFTKEINRISEEAAVKVTNGESTALLAPINDRRFIETNGVVEPVVTIARANAVKRVIDLTRGISQSELPNYRDKAEVAVFTSPENGSPVISELTYSIPTQGNGSAEIHEMNFYSSGSPEITDTQVLVISK